MSKNKRKAKSPKRITIRTLEPVRCHLWGKDKLSSDDFRMDTIKTYVNESHFERLLMRCKVCGQKYYVEYLEFINWSDGDDQQFGTYIPVDPTEDTIKGLNSLSSNELLGIVPRLQWDSKSQPRWVR